MSANLRQPSGQTWEEFTQDVVNSFSDPRFDGFSKIADPNQVRIVNHNVKDYNLPPLLCPNVPSNILMQKCTDIITQSSASYSWHAWRSGSIIAQHAKGCWFVPQSGQS